MNAQRSRALVMVVDDSTTQAQKMAQALEAAGFRTRLAQNGRDALEQARRWRPDVIVSDILMPVMDGFALCREVRRDPELAQVPVVLYTITYVDPKDEEFARGIGASRFLVKPKDPEALVQEIRMALANGHTASATAPAGPGDEAAFVAAYSERLAAKLEEKITDLEAANRQLSQHYEEALAARDQLAVLLKTAEIAVSSLDLDAVLDRLALHLVTALRITCCRISLVDAGGDHLVVVAARAIRELDWDRRIGQRIPLADAPVHRAALLAREPHVVALDSAESPMPAAERAVAGLEGLRTALLLPMAIGEQSIGLICLGEARMRRRAPITEAQLRLGRAMAEEIGLAIEHARAIREREQAQAALRESNRRLEEALSELQAMHPRLVQQERLRALGEMASGIAHDFNNALSPIVGFTELLLKRPADLADREKAIGYLELISTAAQDAAGIVSRLREFSRPREEGEALLPVQVSSLVEQTIALTQPRWRNQASASGITIDIRTEHGDTPPIAGNESELREMLTNLIFNAVDAMPHGGTITLRTRREAARVLLEVQDTGTGMSEEVRRRCLEPFFSTKGEGGSGLGLAQVYGIVERHAGSIDIASALGQGTTFSVRLPAWAASHTEATGSPTPVGGGGGRPLRVLVVDDEPLVRRVVAEYLTSDEHVVETAASGADGLEKLRAGRFDLVITDRSMPEMSGDEVAAAVKALAPHTPVMLLTGFGEVISAAGEKAGAVDDVVGKPVTLSTLREALARVVPRP
ncbi:MAG: response regulator [Chloroflexi bacterium]|nr:response regulator [Chloroflexota bacterium]